MSRDDWGRSPRKPKQKRDSWSKPKRSRHHKEFGAVPKKDRKKSFGMVQKSEQKKDRNWGKPEGSSKKGILSELGGEGRARTSWLSRFFRPKGIGLRQYYNKLDKLQASEIQAGVREQVAEYYNDRIERAESVGDKLQRFVEGITRKRLSSGQVDNVRQIAKEVISPNRLVAFVTNLFK